MHTRRGHVRQLDLDLCGTYADTGAEYISIGAITHSAVALDIALDIVPDLTPEH